SALSLAWGVAAGARDLSIWVAAVAIGASAAGLGHERAAGTARASAMIVGGGSALHAVVGWPRGARGLEVHGLQGNANWLGLVLAIAIPLTLDSAMRSSSPSRRLVRGLAAVLVALESLALVLSHARVAWVALALSAAIAIPWKSVR